LRGRRSEVEYKFCKRVGCGKVVPRKQYGNARQSVVDYDDTDYCSSNCYTVGRRTHIPIEGRICKYKKCGKVLVRKHYKNSRRNNWKQIESIEAFNIREYCDMDCYQLDRRKNKSLGTRNRWNRCWHCNNQLARKEKEGLSDWRDRKFCDYFSCYKLYKEDHEGHVSESLKQNPCKVCGIGTRKEIDFWN
jgi:hypothetical protein